MTSHSRLGSRELHGPVHHVFVDFENVQEIDLTPFTGETVKVTILVGERQKPPRAGLIQEWLERACEVRLIKVNASGQNALDLALAYHLGTAVSRDPTGRFHIVSKDKDFDPLVAHLGDRSLPAFRHDKFSVRPILVAAKPAVVPAAKPAGAIDKVAIMAGRLRKNVATRPKQEKRLLTHVKAQFRGKLQDGEADKIVESLVDRGVISIDSKGKVTYRLSDGPPS